MTTATSAASHIGAHSAAAASQQQQPNGNKVPEDSRVYDFDGFYLRAACLCVRDASEREVLLVSSPRRGPDRWLVPGGKLDPGETSEAAAARETLEEAGAVGVLGRRLGVFDNEARGHRTSVYVLHVDRLLDTYLEGDVRRRRWFGLEEAKRALDGHHKSHIEYVAALDRGGGNVKQDANTV